MNCPKCGLQAQPDQKFCRVCGAGLQMTTQPLADLERSPAVSAKYEKQRVSKLTLLGFIIMFIGIALGLTGKKLLNEEMLTVVGVLVAVAGMFLTAYSGISPPSRQKFDSSPSSQPKVLSTFRPDKYLPHERNIEYVPSITERTTNLLENSAATRPKQKEDGDSSA